MGFILKSGNKNYTQFESGTVRLNYASVGSSFSFRGVYDPEDAFHRTLFKPLSYPVVEIFNTNGTKLLTGRILNHDFDNTANKRTVTFEGASITSVLSECTIPISSYPIEFNGLSLKDIAESLAGIFDLSVVVSNDDGVASEVIPEVEADTSQNIFSFLVEIAAQRNLIVTHDAHGNVLITRTLTNIRSIATYREEIPATQIKLNVNGQRMHSEIGAMGQADFINDNAAEGTIQNTLVSAFRPIVRNQTVGNDESITDMLKHIRSSELRNIQVTINSDRWEWLNSYKNDRVDVASPNNIVDVIAPEVFIPKRTAFFVDSVDLNLDSEKETSVLSCVVPEVYNNQDPIIRF